MWGTPHESNPDSLLGRFIPTHVGNTSAVWQGLRPYPVHPHACGEHVGTSSMVMRPVGSSPRMWGTLLRFAHLDRLPRFIPTHVGNTSAPRALWGWESVHPHACGEHRSLRDPYTNKPGSSPRMWGTRAAPIHELHKARFIPTHVGNTRPNPAPYGGHAVHPHACGEHVTEAFLSPAASGSSPRMWGTRVVSDQDGSHGRFIPTHVGNTLPTRPVSRSESVHPHACGEHKKRKRNACGEDGSSPRMWGTRSG